MIQLKQFTKWVTGSDLKIAVQKTRRKLLALIGFILFVFLFVHNIIIINITLLYFGVDNPNSFLKPYDRPVPLIFLGLVMTILLWSIIMLGGWIMLYFILKPVSDNIKEKENFIANAQHELKTPLTIMKSELELFDETGLNLTQSKDLVTLKRQNTKLIDLVQNLLTNLHEEESKYFETDLNLTHVVEEALEDLSSLYPDFKSKITYELNNRKSINGNKVLFNQLIFAIFENAFKHGAKPLNLKIIQDNNSIIISNNTKAISVNIGDGIKSIYELNKRLGFKSSEVSIVNNEFVIKIITS
ncbi:MAG: sensor histidine kinase [Patescibacteria group bacterium]